VRKACSRKVVEQIPYSVDPGLRVTGLQIIVWSLALVPVTMLPALFGMAGPVYFVSALLMGSAFTAFGVLCAARKGRSEARQLFFASIIYLPFLLAAMMIDKVTF
jgi:protoheme IX farnesyltransferase